jgi:hypothetical protein
MRKTAIGLRLSYRVLLTAIPKFVYAFKALAQICDGNVDVARPTFRALCSTP